MDSPYLTTAEVAAYLRVDAQTVRRWCAEGVLTAFRAGRVYRVRKDEVDRFVRTGLPS